MDNIPSQITSDEVNPETIVIRSINKNAYEIRSDILSMSLDFVKWKTSLTYDDIKKEKMVLIPDLNEVLDVAKHFYSFVENKRH